MMPFCGSAVGSADKALLFARLRSCAFLRVFFEITAATLAVFDLKNEMDPQEKDRRESGRSEGKLFRVNLLFFAGMAIPLALRGLFVCDEPVPSYQKGFWCVLKNRVSWRAFSFLAGMFFLACFGWFYVIHKISTV